MYNVTNGNSSTYWVTYSHKMETRHNCSTTRNAECHVPKVRTDKGKSSAFHRCRLHFMEQFARKIKKCTYNIEHCLLPCTGVYLDINLIQFEDHYDCPDMLISSANLYFSQDILPLFWCGTRPLWRTVSTH